MVMNKKELLIRMREVGSLVPTMILDIFNDYEEVPQELVDVILNDVPGNRQHFFVYYTGPVGKKILDEVMQHYAIFKDLKVRNEQRN